jgi:hypothetical protein
MEPFKRVGVREFRDHATHYLGGEDPLVVERHGQPIGFYIPTGGTHQASFAAALQSLGQMVRTVLADTGLSEEELAELFDLTKPVRGRPNGGSRRRRNDADAAGG